MELCYALQARGDRVEGGLFDLNGWGNVTPADLELVAIFKGEEDMTEAELIDHIADINKAEHVWQYTLPDGTVANRSAEIMSIENRDNFHK